MRVLHAFQLVPRVALGFGLNEQRFPVGYLIHGCYGNITKSSNFIKMSGFGVLLTQIALVVNKMYGFNMSHHVTCQSGFHLCA